MADGPRVLGVAWLVLSQAALCRHCEKFYDREEPACPACGASQRRLVADFLGRATG